MSKQDQRLRRRDHSPDRLLDRILNTPQLAKVVPQLQPDVLHRLIQHCGLEECGELVALATPGQLAQVFDLDLWRADQPGLDEQFDADRFGVWLTMIAEAGPAVAAQTLTAMEPSLVATGFAHHIRVIDYSAVNPYMSTDGEEVNPGYWLDESFRCEVGGYVVLARRTDAWEAIAAVLVALDETEPDYFSKIMNGCRSLSSSLPEVDGLDDLLTTSDQAVFDVAVDREGRRDVQGYVTPAQARAFLQTARQAAPARGTGVTRNIVANAYFRDRDTSAPIESSVPDAASDAVDAVVELLHDAGILDPKPRALLNAPEGPANSLTPIQTQMQLLHDQHPDLFSTRSAELAFLGNTLMAGVSVQSRSFLADEASNAAVAVCNLGLENWPGQSGDVLVHHDLVEVFEVGWRTLYQNVCMYAAERLIEMLAALECPDEETQESLDALRVRMTRQWRAGTPWAARDALEVIAILDAPAWAALLGLVDEFPVLHDAVGASLSGDTRGIDATAFEFISENSQIALVRDFMRTLPDRLR